MEKRLFSFLVFLTFFAAESFFFIPGMPDWRISFIFLSVLLFVIFRRPFHLKKSGFAPFIICYSLLWVISGLFTYTHDVGPLDTEIRSYALALPLLLLFRPLVNIGNKYGIKSLFSPFVFFSRLTVVVLLLQYLGVIHIMSAESLSEREGMRSFVGTLAMAFGLLISFHKILFIKSRNNLSSWIWVVLTLLGIILVNQSRSLIFAVAGAMSILLYFRFNSLLKRAGCLATLIKFFVVIVVVYYAYHLVLNIIGQSYSSGEASSVNRLAAYIYYWQKFLEYPLTGFGLSTTNSLISEGVFSFLYAEDIGVVGYLGQTGLLGVVTQIAIIVCYIRCLKNMDSRWSYLFISIGAFYILISPFNSFMYTHQEYVCYSLAMISSVSNQFKK